MNSTNSLSSTKKRASPPNGVQNQVEGSTKPPARKTNYQRVLRKSMAYLTHNTTNIFTLCVVLQSNKVISHSDVQQIMAYPMDNQKMYELITLCTKKCQSAYDLLLIALHESNNPHALKELEKTEDSLIKLAEERRERRPNSGEDADDEDSEPDFEDDKKIVKKKSWWQKLIEPCSRPGGILEPCPVDASNPDINGLLDYLVYMDRYLRGLHYNPMDSGEHQFHRFEGVTYNSKHPKPVPQTQPENSLTTQESSSSRDHSRLDLGPRPIPPPKPNKIPPVQPPKPANLSSHEQPPTQPSPHQLEQRAGTSTVAPSLEPSSNATTSNPTIEGASSKHEGKPKKKKKSGLKPGSMITDYTQGFKVDRAIFLTKLAFYGPIEKLIGSYTVRAQIVLWSFKGQRTIARKNKILEGTKDGRMLLEFRTPIPIRPHRWHWIRFSIKGKHRLMVHEKKKSDKSKGKKPNEETAGSSNAVPAANANRVTPNETPDVEFKFKKSAIHSTVQLPEIHFYKGKGAIPLSVFPPPPQFTIFGTLLVPFSRSRPVIHWCEEKIRRR